MSICRPLYCDYPDTEEAYAFKDEYMYGDSMIVAPITKPSFAETGLAGRTVWLPDGTWVEWFTGTTLKGPARFERQFALGEIPVYVKAGSVIPMQPKMRHTGERPVDPLILSIFPQASGSTRVYEDEGNSLGYKKDACPWTEVRHAKQQDGKLKIEILPAKGSYPGMPASRSYQIRLMSALPPSTVRCNGKPLGFVREGSGPGWTYDGNRLSPVITTPVFDIRQGVEIIYESLKGPEALLDGFALRRARLQSVMNRINSLWPGHWSPDQLVELVQTGRRLELNPGAAVAELEKFQRGTAEVIDLITKMGLPPETLKPLLAALRTM